MCSLDPTPPPHWKKEVAGVIHVAVCGKKLGADFGKGLVLVLR